MKKRHIALSFGLVAALLLSVNAGAQTEDTPYSEVNKTADYDYSTRTGKITLDSYVTGVAKTVSSGERTAADIVLVLDYSSSMKDNGKNTMLQKAANDFVDQMAGSSSASQYTRIALVTFGTGAHMKTDFLALNNSSNVTKLHSYINETCPAPNEGATRYDLALWIASNIIYGGTGGFVKNQNNSSDAKNKDREKITDIDWASYGNLITSSGTYGTGAIDPYPKIAGSDYSKYIKKASLTGLRSGITPYIVFLTDGQPTNGGSSLGDFGKFYVNMSDGIRTIDRPGYGDSSDASRYDTSTSNATQYAFGVANYAIKIAKDLKENKGVKIYSIHVEPTTSKIATFAEDCITAICSKYPNAQRYRKSYWGTKSTETNADLYYQRVTTSQTSISGAFSSIAESIVSVSTLKYGTETVMTDFINNDYFKLPDNVKTSDIIVRKVKCTGVASDGTTRTFSTASADTTSVSGVTVTITKHTETQPNDKISVTGFDYSANWCGLDENNQPHGYKLLVTLPFEFTGGEDDSSGSGSLKTNGSGSGLYPAKRDDSGNVITGGDGKPTYEDEPDDPYPFPEVEFCSIKIIRNDLQANDSAIYSVVCDGKVVATVSLNGTGSQVSKNLIWLPGGNYTVTETSWNWEYNKTHKENGSDVAGGVITRNVTDTNTISEFIFGGTHKTGTGAENVPNHDEKYKTNTMDVKSL